MKADDEYPQDISDEDGSLGLERIEIPQDQSIGDGVHIVVARKLSPSDILVKIVDPDGAVQFSHRRWGRSTGSDGLLSWHSLEVPFSFEEAAVFIQEYDFTVRDFGGARLFGGIVGIPFEH